MRNLRLMLCAVTVSLLFFTACQKEQITPQIDEDQGIVFVPADKSSATENMDLLRQIQNGVMTNTSAEKRSSEALNTYCCAMNSLTKVVVPWDPTLINLNIKYDVSTTSQVVQIKHWYKPPGGSYSYLGQDNIPSSYTTCTMKSINMSTGHLAGAGDYISWARIYDGSSYCGGSQVLQWNMP